MFWLEFWICPPSDHVASAKLIVVGFVSGAKPLCKSYDVINIHIVLFSCLQGFMLNPTLGNSNFIRVHLPKRSGCCLGALGVDAREHRLRLCNLSFACKPCVFVFFIKRASKWRIMQEAPSSKAVRQGDPREQGCVWKIWRSAWSSMTASLLLYTPPFFHFQFQGCTGSPGSIHTFTILSSALLSGILFIHRWLFA